MSNYEIESFRDGSNVPNTLDIKKERVKNSILIILGLIIGILGVFSGTIMVYYQDVLNVDIRILFLLIGAIICFYGSVNYFLVNRGDSYEKMRHPIEDFTVIIMAPIFVFIIITLLKINPVFIGITRGYAYMFKWVFGILIGALVAGPSLYYLYLYRFRQEEYQKIIGKKEKRLTSSQPLELFRIMPMRNTYSKFSLYYKQVFGASLLVGILLFNLNFYLSSLGTYFAIFMYIQNFVRTEFLFILAGIIILRSRKIGFFIFQIALIWLVIWAIVSPILPLVAIFFV